MITSDKLALSMNKLQEERDTLLEEIKEHEKPEVFGVDSEDEDAEADGAEEFSNRLGVAHVLKERLEEVENAINKIKEGTYGMCEKCHRVIEESVLDASPAMPYCQECGSQH